MEMTIVYAGPSVVESKWPRVWDAGVNRDKPYHSMRELVAAAVASRGDVVLDLANIAPDFKFPILTMLSKHAYKFSKYRSQKPRSRTFVIHDNDVRVREMVMAIHYADLARDLQNEPSNHMLPEILARNVRSRLRAAYRVRVMDEREIEQRGMGLIMAVGQGSDHPPRFVVAKRMKDPNFPTICLVGKGVTFDAGGLRLKPASSMMDMKQDKSGAAVVATILAYIAEVAPHLEVNLVGIMPMVENVINGTATRPGDVVTAHDGSNVEVMDTDAEGRLIIADAISYSKKFKPDYIIDFGTLTSFASNLCCDLSSVHYTPSDAMSELVSQVAEATGERTWRLPPWTEYSRDTTSTVADMRNAIFNCTRGGSYMAAMFISNFVPKSNRRLNRTPVLGAS
jgi:leucyl aminopeptidase